MNQGIEEVYNIRGQLHPDRQIMYAEAYHEPQKRPVMYLDPMPTY